MILLVTSTAFAADKIKEGKDWDKGLLIMKGNAVSPTKLRNNKRFYKNFARQGAQFDALRMLVECIIDGLTINEGSITITKSDMAFRLIENGARQIGDAIFYDDGVCEVYMSLPLFGENSLAQALCLSLKNQQKDDFPQPTIVKDIPENYTGLIVDCRGFEVYRTFTPNISYKISEKDSVAVYSPKYLDFNKIGETFINHGMVSYVRDVSEATRAGKNPLVIKTVSHKVGDAYISVADAVLILNANRTSGFLDNAAVVFLCDSFDN
jgi:hypothetical protein